MKNCPDCKLLLSKEKFHKNVSSCMKCTAIKRVLNTKCNSCGDKIKERHKGESRVKSSAGKWYCCSDCRYEHERYVLGEKSIVQVHNLA